MAMQMMHLSLHKLKVPRMCGGTKGILHQMQHGDFPPSSIPKERDQIVHHMARFHWEDGLVFQRWPNETRKMVPRPD